jgi:glycosyltransferase involved in cell wall biosynthesis
MLQHIALMITCNEEDCIEEVMNEHTKYFDKILVLDGSTDRTEEIIRSFKEVKYFLKDKEIIHKLPKHKFEDGARQFLLEKAQEMYGCQGWFTLLHGDEIFHDNPVEAAERAEKEGAEKINWYTMNFFLHMLDKDKDQDLIKSIQQRLTWYCPGFFEVRQFKNKEGIYYDLGQRHKVLPNGIGWRTYRFFPIYKHYPFRSVKQMLGKRLWNEKSGFSTTYRKFEKADDCFLERLPGYNLARRFDGSFHEFELDKQGSLLRRWLRAHRYLPVRIGKRSAWWNRLFERSLRRK